VIVFSKNHNIKIKNMKKTMTVNIGGSMFHIDEDAYEVLNKYLSGIKDELIGAEGGEEIYNDIEIRISELFIERIKNDRQVITLPDVQEIILIMGKPGDISGDPQEKKSSHESYRRMYRDPDNRIIGGVCSGLASYWRVDPTIVRIIFVLLCLFGMAGLLIYLILWIVLPEASTVAQKLEMRGEPVNLSNITEFFRQEFENVKKSFRRK
jgi:phage shock protein PspC (stress-responsive transcriptional regulator)